MFNIKHSDINTKYKKLQKRKKLIMKTQIILLRITGIISFIFMLFHFAFYKLFDWENTLHCLSQANRAIMLTYHYASILITGFMSIILIFQAKVLLISQLKYSILSLFALFYLIRIITEFSLFGFAMPQSLIITTMCAIPVIFITIPIFYKSKN
jgi:magnesium-transporting ATPase (P-type)